MPSDPKPEQPRRDSRLNEFLRCASPILASERGWNERSQLKIKSLADDLNLPEDLYAIGVERLQQGEFVFKEKLSQYEKAFIKYLKKQLGRSNNTVLTAAHETKAIRVARRKYEIPKIRARQLVREVAEDIGMTRVSKLDAVEFVASVVDETIGQGTTVPDPVRGRIYESAEKWGVDSNQVEILIRNRIEANRQTSIPNNPWKIRLLAGALSIVFMIGLIWAVLAFFGETLQPPEPEPAPGETESAQASEKETPLFQPEPTWWTEETSDSFREFTSNSRAARFAHHTLKSDDPSERLTGYRRIVNLIRDNEGDFEQVCFNFYLRAFAEEDDATAEAMLQQLQEFARLDFQSMPSNLDRFQEQWKINRLLIAALPIAMTESRVDLLDRVGIQLAAVSIRRTDFLDASQQALRTLQWQFFISRSFQNPERAAQLINPLAELLESQFDEPSKSEYVAIVNLLDIRPGVWTYMRRRLAKIVERSDQDQQRELYLQKSKSNVPELQSWLGTRLAHRLGIKTDQLTSSRIDNAIEKKLNLTISKAPTVNPRHASISENGICKNLLEKPVTANPQTIGQATHFATILILIQQGQLTGDRKWTEEADRLLAESPRNLAIRSNRQSLDLPIYRTTQRRALPSDVRALEESQKHFAEFEAHTPEKNALAFKRLGTVAPRFRELDRQAADNVARFMLTATETVELVNIEKFAPLMRHWPNLALALANQVVVTDGSLDQALTCGNLLLDLQFKTIESNDRWRPKFKQLMLQRIVEGLQYTGELEGDESRFQWAELRDMLMQHYRLRCAAYSIPGSTISGCQNPAELAELLLVACSENASQARRQLQANQYLTDDELSRFVLQSRAVSDYLGATPEEASFQLTEDSSKLARELLKNELRIIQGLLQ